MPNGRRWGKTAVQNMSPEERRQLEHDTRLAIYRFQDSACRNLRHSIAASTIILGLFIGSDAVLGNAPGLRPWPCIILLIAAGLGIASFAAGSPPRLAVRLLVGAVVATVAGLVFLGIVAFGMGR